MSAVQVVVHEGQNLLTGRNLLRNAPHTPASRTSPAAHRVTIGALAAPAAAAEFDLSHGVAPVTTAETLTAAPASVTIGA